MTLTKNSLSTLFLTLAVCVPVAAQDGPTAMPTATGGPTTAENWWHKFWGQVDLHRKRVNVWPEPFVGHDRELVRGPFRQMADNGWKTQNTFSDYLFDPGSNELNAAGQAKLAIHLDADSASPPSSLCAGGGRPGGHRSAGGIHVSQHGPDRSGQVRAR